MIEYPSWGLSGATHPWKRLTYFFVMQADEAASDANWTPGEKKKWDSPKIGRPEAEVHSAPQQTQSGSDQAKDLELDRTWITTTTATTTAASFFVTEGISCRPQLEAQPEAGTLKPQRGGSLFGQLKGAVVSLCCTVQQFFDANFPQASTVLQQTDSSSSRGSFAGRG
jgi:hypothetical protein